MKQIRKLLVITGLLLGLSVAPLALSGVVSAEGNITNCGGINACLDQGSTDVDPEGGDEDANTAILNLVQTAVNVFSWIVGVAAVLAIIYGGFKYITSGGDQNSISAAKTTILYAIVGLIVVVFAQIIVRFIVTQFQPGGAAE
jgi:hypothetical protein